MTYDARCTLTHLDDDRDMGCYMCQTYGNVHDSPHAAAIVRDDKRRQRALRREIARMRQENARLRATAAR